MRASLRYSTMAKRNEDILHDHPEFLEKARALFTYDKTPVIQETVPRGDVQQPTMNPGEITSDDVNGLAEYAVKAVDPRIQESDRAAAVEDAVLRAINEKDGGRFSGRVSAVTAKLISTRVEELLKKAPAKSENLNEKMMAMAQKGGKEESSPADPAQTSVYDEARIEDKPSDNKGPKAMGKEAGKVDDVVKALGTKLTKNQANSVKTKASQEGSISKKTIEQNLEAVAPKAAPAAPKKSKKASEILALLDKVASQVEEAGLKHLAAQIDVVSNTLEGM